MNLSYPPFGISLNFDFYMFISKEILYNMIIFYGKRVIYYDSQLFRICIKSKGTGRLIELKSSVRKKRRRK
ncbi:hypothetical protein CN507_05075 [Bacillus cereus]|nr:hypothetical protein CN485_29015 [Bacillus cereus]PES72526.1 hypothetical protein CN507_05075 [Bacillus cereus]PEY82923.1 hypothetical protein CN349_31690 [Bacillus cereus]PFH91809.1 hypothetical protein COI81_07535 [Bacillus cereus]PFM23426.1 hypothetical protein COJ42_30740 [Bacillus cereus]